MNKSLPAIYTFGAVFVVILLVGAVTVPFLLGYAEHDGGRIY